MMGLGKSAQKALVGIFLGPEAFLIRKMKVKNKEMAEKAKSRKSEQLKAASLAEFAERKKAGLVDGGSARGIGGSGTLLTGSGGLKDPALTGKNTLLGTG